MKNLALVLSGGTGGRFGTEVPKQYQRAAGKPVLVHTLEKLQRCAAVEGVIVVSGPQWEDSIRQWGEEFSLTKLVKTAPAGTNRQLSIRSGLLAAQEFMDEDAGIIVQDAVRPLASPELLTALIENLRDAPAVLPVLPVTDTAYTSGDGQWVEGLLNRSELYGGQAPESFHYWPYLALYRDTPEAQLSALSGSCQLPYRAGWRVKMIPGERENIKITYAADLEFCEWLLRKREETE